MNKKDKITLIVDLVGGLVFGSLFFVIYTINEGFNWYIFLLCYGMGLIWGISFYFLFGLFTKKSKTPSFDNKKSQKKLEEYESEQGLESVYKVNVHMWYGEGMKLEICETSVYFKEGELHIVFVHFGKILNAVIKYDEIDYAYIQSNYLVFVLNMNDIVSVLLKNTNGEMLKELIFMLKKYNIYELNKRKQVFKLFNDSVGIKSIELQYCKTDDSNKKRRMKNRALDSLYIDIDTSDKYDKLYFKYFQIDSFDFKYISKFQSKEILMLIERDQPEDYEILLDWLHIAINKYNGFYFLGI